ncbi:MAG: type II secretion system F family protein, partial [Kiritimatiellae bacterium]|nr:type II secretion system F family protein [Kiritimatiellia bacterium]
RDPAKPREVARKPGAGAPPKGKKDEKAVAGGAPGGGGRGRPRMKNAQLLLFTGELVDLLSSGMTIGAALHALSHRKTGKAQDVIIPALRDDIVGGASLSSALAKWPESFPELYVSMVKVGEASGQLPAVLQRLQGHFERTQAAREKVSMALVYPAIVALVGVGAIIFMMVFVIPQFTRMFEELGGTLPLPTRMMIGMSRGLVRWGWLLALGLVVGGFAFREFLKTPGGRAWKDRVVLRLPAVGGIVRAGAFSNFAHTLGTLLSNGVQMFPALAIVENTVGNSVIAAAVRETRDRVADGSSLSRPLAQNGVFPKMLTDMLAVGEETGDMATALDHIGKRYDNELDRAVKLLTTLLEPFMMLFIALGVGFVAVAMISAVFEMTSGLQR